MTEPKARTGTLHHVEVRVGDLGRAEREWAWLVTALGYQQFQRWEAGVSWRCGHTYPVLEQAAYDGEHDRRRPGLSHLAFHAGTRAGVDRLWATVPERGWSRLYTDQSCPSEASRSNQRPRCSTSSRTQAWHFGWDPVRRRG